MPVATSSSSIGAIAALILLAGLGGCSALAHATTKASVQAVVTDKERIARGNSSKYLIFTDRETFENTDSLLAGKFDSSDIYGRIQPGQVCNFRVVGWRIPFLSTYRNILSAECGA